MQISYPQRNGLWVQWFFGATAKNGDSENCGFGLGSVALKHMPYLWRSHNPSVHHFYITTQLKFHGRRGNQAATGGRREVW